MRTAQDEAETAAHEAGHACLNLALGLPVGLVALSDQPGGGVAGFCCPATGMTSAEILCALAGQDAAEPPSERAGDLVAPLLALLAGPIAEARARGVAYSPSDIGGWRDRFVAEHLVGRALRRPPYSRQVREFLALVEAAAAGRVHEHWLWIQRTADALITARELTGDQVRSLRP